MIYTSVLHNEQRTSLRTNGLFGDITYDFSTDALKYRRLNLLRNYFEQRDSSNIPLLNVFYSVADDTEDKKIKIEAISHELKGETVDCFDLPDSGDIRTVHSLILRHILSFINS